MLRRWHVCLAVLLACGAATVSAAGGSRKLKQLSVFYDTPAAAGSTSVGLNGGLAVRPDGTVHAAAGGSTASTTAVSNPLLNILTGGAYKNRPKAASSAYTQIPLLQQFSIFPTLSYGLAEGKGDALSTSNGGWANAEFGYNPINNNLGASVSAGTSNSANVGASERVGEVNPDAGASGVEFAGYSNDLTNAADARTDQSAQAIAYPYNILSPINPLTCTQALLYAVTITQYDLGAPVASLPREQPPSVVPFCLSLFNFGTLDDFSQFVNNANNTNTNTTNAQFFDQGNGRIAAVESNPRLAAALRNATGSTQVFQRAAAPGNSTTAPGATNVTALSGNNNGSVVMQPPGVLVGPLPAARSAGGSGSARSADANSSSGGDLLPPPTLERPQPGVPGGKSGAGQQGSRLQSFSDALNAAVKKSPGVVQVLFESGPGKALLDRLGKGVVAEAVDGINRLIATQGAKAIGRFADPLAELNKAASNVTQGLAAGVGQVGLKAAVAAVEAAEPMLAARAALNKAVTPSATKSKEEASRLAQQAAERVAQTIDALPEGADKQAVATFKKINAPNKAAGTPGAGGAAAQMG